MAQFDVYRLVDGALVVDCQSDLLRNLQSRFVVPLLPPTAAVMAGQRLNPILKINDEDYVLVPQGAGSLLRGELGRPIASMADHDFAITAAIDVLTGGI